MDLSWNRALTGLALALGVAVLAAVAWKGYAMLQINAELVLDTEPCDLHREACRATLADGRAVTLSVTPRPIQMQEWLTLSVTLDGIDATAVAIDFASDEMYMGYNRPQLEALGDDRFQGRTVLPVCVANSMTWQAQVLVESPGGLMVAPFTFKTWRRQS